MSRDPLVISTVFGPNETNRLWREQPMARLSHTCCGVNLYKAYRGRVYATASPPDQFERQLAGLSNEAKGKLQILPLKKRISKRAIVALEKNGWAIVGSSRGHNIWGKVAGK